MSENISNGSVWNFKFIAFQSLEKRICKSVFVTQVLCYGYFMLVLKGQPCAMHCVSTESKVGVVGRRGSEELM